MIMLLCFLRIKNYIIIIKTLFNNCIQYYFKYHPHIACISGCSKVRVDDSFSIFAPISAGMCCTGVGQLIILEAQTWFDGLCNYCMCMVVVKEFS